MSKMIQIRNVPDEIHRELKSRAAKAGMSLSDFLLAEIKRIVAQPPMQEVLERIRSRPPTGITNDQIVEIIREMRGE